MTIKIVEKYLGMVKLRNALYESKMHPTPMVKLAIMVFNWVTFPLLIFTFFLDKNHFEGKENITLWSVIFFSSLLTLNYIGFWHLRQWRVRCRLKKLEQKIALMQQDLFAHETLRPTNSQPSEVTLDDVPILEMTESLKP